MTRLSHLRALAEKATKGPWRTTEGGAGTANIVASDGAFIAHAAPTTDAAYIAALSPDTVLALLDALDVSSNHFDDISGTFVADEFHAALARVEEVSVTKETTVWGVTVGVESGNSAP